MTRSSQLLSGLTLALCLASASHAAPLYLSEEEFETDDRAVMAGIVDHCAGFRPPEPSTETGASGASGAEEEGGGKPVARGGGAAFDGETSTIAVDLLASGEAAGGDDELPDLSDVTEQHCQAAGIMY